MPPSATVPLLLLHQLFGEGVVVYIATPVAAVLAPSQV